MESFRDVAEAAGFDVPPTTDKIQHQLNLVGCRIAMVALGQSELDADQAAGCCDVAAVDAAEHGSFVEVETPLTKR
jgi:hypothetical protein